MSHVLRFARASMTARAFVLALAALVALPAFASAADVCADVDAKGRFYRLGRAPFAPSAPISDLAELQQVFSERGDEIAALLDGQGLGDVAAPLAAAVAAGEVGEAELTSGQHLEWMAYRKGGEAKLIEPACYAGKKAYPSYAIDVEVPQAVEVPSAVCSIDGSGDPESRTISISSGGSSPGAVLSMKPSEGTAQTLTVGADGSWSGPWTKRYCQEVEFAVAAPGPTVEQTVDGYSFLVPQACGNLSLAGRSSRTQQLVGANCRETLTVQRIPAPDPSAELDLSDVVVLRGRTLHYKIAGHWDVDGECGVTDPIVVAVLDSDGNEIWRATDAEGTFEIPKMGQYTVSVITKNEIGEAARVEQMVTVDPRWIVRGFLGRLMPGSETVHQSRIVPDPDAPADSLSLTGIEETSSVDLSDGNGFGVAVERRLSHNWGVEVAGIVGSLDAHWMVDRGALWEMDSDDPEFSILAVGPVYHFLQHRRADLYAGVFVAQIGVDNADFVSDNFTPVRRFDSDVSYGAQVGLDWGFADYSAWALHAGVRYFDSELEVNGEAGEAEFDFSPLWVEVGLSYRF